MNSERQIIKRWRRGIGIPVTAFAMAAALFSGCSQDEGPELDGDGLVAVNFTATVDGVALPTAKSAGTRSGVPNFTGTTDAGVPYRDYIDADGFQTRAFYPGTTGSKTGCANAPATRTTDGGDEWTTTDRVGIFMLAAEGDEMLAGNVQYNVTDAATGALSLSDGETPIYYPQSRNVYFVAYYPYGSVAEGEYNVTVTVNGQTDETEQNALDVLYAKTLGAPKSKEAVELAFGHVLSKITLNVTLGTGFTDDDDKIASVTFSGMPRTATLDLQDGTLSADPAEDFPALKAEEANDGFAATFTALLVPQDEDYDKDRTVVFTVDGTSYTWKIDDTDTFEKGNHYTYPVTVSKTGIEFGVPTINKWDPNDHGTGKAEPLPIETVKIKAGTFQMGEVDGVDNPAHDVTLTQDFYMSKYEITNAQYAEFLKDQSIGEDGKGTVSYGSVIADPQIFIRKSSGTTDSGLHWNSTR